jgi:hypothetical protein
MPEADVERNEWKSENAQRRGPLLQCLTSKMVICERWSECVKGLSSCRAGQRELSLVSLGRGRPKKEKYKMARVQDVQSDGDMGQGSAAIGV